MTSPHVGGPSFLRVSTVNYLIRTCFWGQVAGPDTISLCTNPCTNRGERGGYRVCFRPCFHSVALKADGFESLRLRQIMIQPGSGGPKPDSQRRADAYAKGLSRCSTTQRCGAIRRPSFVGSSSRNAKRPLSGVAVRRTPGAAETHSHSSGHCDESLEFGALTAARTGEVLGLTWEEISAAGAVADLAPPARSRGAGLPQFCRRRFAVAHLARVATRLQGIVETRE